jgi:hypothetical protein
LDRVIRFINSNITTNCRCIFFRKFVRNKLNIDYSDFNNFVFYSSATERLENFKYKLELLEYYTSQSIAVSQLSGSVATTNVQDFLNLKTI